MNPLSDPPQPVARPNILLITAAGDPGADPAQRHLLTPHLDIDLCGKTKSDNETSPRFFKMISIRFRHLARRARIYQGSCSSAWRCLCGVVAAAAFLFVGSSLMAETDTGADPVRFNRQPLAAKPYAELPLGAIEPRSWLLDELQRMANGSTGHMDEWYPEVCGPRNAWLGGDGDNWERGLYWIDGLYPLAKILRDPVLEAKAMKWIEWTLTHQRPDGYIGPVEIAPADRKQPPPAGAMVQKADDWWPRMIMLKILQQHYLATGDERVIACLGKYFQYQLATLPRAPLSGWAAERGGDNLMVVLWLYNVTGEPSLLSLAGLIEKQTEPYTDDFERGRRIPLRRDQARDEMAFHCVNLAQGMKMPLIVSQLRSGPRYLAATRRAWHDIDTFHGQPHGLFGGDEWLHGDSPDRGSEFCTAVEMMFSLEKMIEITGAADFADRLEQIAFNVLPTQATPDHRYHQYFQQVNQVQITHGDHDFFNDRGERLVFGFLCGNPCCACNYHQGWPKFTQHLWLASVDGGLAALVYAPSRVSARVAGGATVSILEETDYPFRESIRFTIETAGPVAFPLHLRIPGWCRGATIFVNGEALSGSLPARQIKIVRRTWRKGDTVELHLPMTLRAEAGFARSVSIHRGPLLFALDVPGEKNEVIRPRPAGVPDSAPHRGYLEYRPSGPWNYALSDVATKDPAAHFHLNDSGAPLAPNPWTRNTTPLVFETEGTRLAEWTLQRNSAAPPPLSPVSQRKDAKPETIRLIPYGATTLRIAAFPWIGRPR